MDCGTTDPAYSNTTEFYLDDFTMLAVQCLTTPTSVMKTDVGCGCPPLEYEFGTLYTNYCKFLSNITDAKQTVTIN